MTREKFNQMNKALIHWEEMINEIEKITQEYEESGWKTLVLHPGDVSTTLGETVDQKVGFRLIVPESELNALADIVDEKEGAYDEFEVHRAPDTDLLLFVVIVKSTERERAIVFPIYYDPKMDHQFVEEVRERETIYTDITNLSGTHEFSFSHSKPTLFLP